MLGNAMLGDSVKSYSNLMLWIGLLGLSACSSAGVVVSECILSQDQTGTLNGRWPATPIELALSEQGNFLGSESLAVVKAVNSWNAFHLASQGFELQDIGPGSNPTTSAEPLTPLVCNPVNAIATGSGFTGKVVIHKVSNWPSSQAGVIALTKFCAEQADPLPNIFDAVIELNYTNFFTEGNQNPDLESIVAHELGHLTGLNHSCEVGSQSESFADCEAESTPAEYIQAMMFPIFTFPDGQNGEVRRSIAVNDMERANCLYSGAL